MATQNRRRLPGVQQFLPRRFLLAFGGRKDSGRSLGFQVGQMTDGLDGNCQRGPDWPKRMREGGRRYSAGEA